MSNKR
jgi:hypothetical protein